MIRWSICPALALLTAWLSSCTLSWDDTWPDAGAPGDSKSESAAKPEAGLTPDMTLKPESGPDGPAVKPDLPGAAAGCSKLGLYKGSYQADMVICGLAKFVNQCQAATLCDAAAGWKLCTASQFLARGGKTGFLVTKAWIASCIRKAGVMQPPSDSVCSCVNSKSTEVGSSWPCAGAGGLTSDNAEVGVRSFNSCRRIGTQASPGGYWKNLAPEKPLSAALCCN